MSSLGQLPGPSVAIGGVGGSGTRVVAAAAGALGIRIGEDLNDPLDNLTYTLLFKDRAVTGLATAELQCRWSLYLKAMHGDARLTAADHRLLESLSAQDRPTDGEVEHPQAWLTERADRIRAGRAGRPLPPGGRWGWKEPNTHVLIPQWMALMPDLRYVHVVRNGLDMAFSGNLNQLHFWGEQFLGRPVKSCPGDALAYWCSVHRRALDWQRQFGDRFLWLDFDALCCEPRPVLERLAIFLGYEAEAAEHLLPLVDSPATRGRGAALSLDEFAPDDLAFLRMLGHLG